MNLQLTGKRVLITGGSKGIGAACARSFAAEGCHLTLVARNAQALARIQSEIVAQHSVDVQVHSRDLRNSVDLDEVAGLCAGVDVLVNNAGDIPVGTIESLDDAQWRSAWELKVFGYINLSRAAFASMKSRGHGVIVNIIGMAAERSSYEYICGSSANAALAAFTKGLGVGSIKAGVRVLGVHPPSTRTERIETMLQAAAQKRYGDASRTADLVRDGVFLPAIDPEQVSDFVAYLASARASQLSGMVMNLG